MSRSNPLLEISPLPDEAPRFDLIEQNDFPPAFDAALAASRRHLASIRSATTDPDFENTIVALEATTEDLDRVSSIFHALLGAESNDALETMAREIAPKLAEFENDVLLDKELFRRVDDVWNQRTKLALNREQERLLENTWTRFVRNGARLDAAGGAQLRKLDAELSQRERDFSRAVLDATNAFALTITDESELAGIPATAIADAALEAKRRDVTGWVFTLRAPSLIPVLEYADHRKHREALWRAHASRGCAGPHDNRERLVAIARLRDERARLLGYAGHAAFTLERRMAKTPEQVREFLKRMGDAAKPAAERELTRLIAARAAEGRTDELMPWDFAWERERLKRQKLNFDPEAVRPWFAAENVIDGAFLLAERLFGIRFTPRSDLPVYHPEVRVMEARAVSGAGVGAQDGDYLGLLYLDLHPRSGKKPGAWMTVFRNGGLVSGKPRRPHVSITANLSRSTADHPALLSLDEARTILHEFGHALHALLSRARYRSLFGTNVLWDFVELPSQFMENFLAEPDSLAILARHHETGAAMPTELIEGIRRSRNFFAGTATLRQTLFATLDLAWHNGAPHEHEDVETFEARAIGNLQILPHIPGTAISPAFTHIFEGGYAAGYYSYKWAEVMEADAFDLFLEKGILSSEVGVRFRDTILARGDTEDPGVLYRLFRGRDPNADALLKRDGLLIP